MQEAYTLQLIWNAAGLCDGVLVVCMLLTVGGLFIAVMHARVLWLSGALSGT